MLRRAISARSNRFTSSVHSASVSSTITLNMVLIKNIRYVSVDNTENIVLNFLITKMMAFSRTHQLRDAIMFMIAAPHCSTAAVIAAGSRWLRSPTLTGPADSPINERPERDNREALEQLRQFDRDAWSATEHRLGDRDRKLGKQRQ
jgi:hypothetical protein